MIANVTVSSERYILTWIYSVRGDALSASRAQYGAMEKWVPCQKDTRKRKAGPHKFSDTAFRAPSPHPVTNQGGFQYFTLKPQRSGTKKPKQVPPPEAVERGNAETLAWVPYPPPLPSASFSSSWRSAVGREHHDKDTQESIIPCILYSKFLCGGKFVMDKPHA